MSFSRFLPIFLNKCLLAVSATVSAAALSLLHRFTRYVSSSQLEEVVENRRETLEEFADVISTALDREVNISFCSAGTSELEAKLTLF